MGFNSLRDLYMSGVQWEISETRQKPQKTKPVAKTLPESSDIISTNVTKPTVVPAVAPVNLSAATNAARSANTFEELATAIKQFDHPLRAFAKNVTVPQFNPGKLLIVTDMPSAEDDETGEILSGAAGELMDKMLSAINLDRKSTSIIPLVFWRTPGGRTPTREELDSARPFIIRTIELLEPSAILTLGTLAGAEFAGAKLPKDHGTVVGDTVKTIPIYHPNYMMLKPDTKRAVWDALQKLQNILKITE